MNKFLALILVFSLAACVGVSRPSTFYNLKPVDEKTLPVDKVKKVTIGLYEVNVPNYLDKPQIVTISEDGLEMKASEFNRWSEPLSTLMQRTIADNISIYLPNSLIKPRSYTRESFDYMVSIQLNKFDGVLGNKVVLDAWWSLLDKDGNSLVKKRFSTQAKLDGSEYTDLVLAESNLVAELSKEIAGQLVKIAGK